MMKNYLSLMLALLLVLAPVSALDLQVVSVDLLTGSQLNPSTITVNGVTQQGTPYAFFEDIPVDAITDIESTAPGYETFALEPFFDADLDTCTGQQTCNLEISGFETTCELITADTYSCVNINNGVIDYFYYNFDFEQVLVVNSLLPDQTNPSNQPPTIVGSASPIAGDSPLLVTFNYQASDDSQVAQVLLNFGDGVVVETPATNAVSHRYTESGTWTATLQAIDDEGLVTQETYTIVVDNEPNLPPSQLPFDDSVIFDIRGIAVDFFSGAQLDPSTLMFGGTNQTGNPYAQFSPARSNEVYDFNATAPGYDFVAQEQYFDFQLPSCTGTTCDLVSRDAFMQVFETHCVFGALDTWECTSENNGVETPFLYRQNGNMILLIGDLVLNTVVNPAPTIAATVTPQSGSSPLQVSFTIDIQDDDNITQAELHFGDGESIELTVLQTVIAHVYNGGGDYVAEIRAQDAEGAVTVESLNIAVSGPRNGRDLIHNPFVYYDVMNLAYDANTGAQIDGATFATIARSGQGNPAFVFNNINSDTLYSVTVSATGYQTITRDQYFDHQLPQCAGPSCNLQSRNAFSEVFTTNCNLENSLYLCASENEGVTDHFFFNPATNGIGLIFDLVDQATIDNGTAPVVNIQATPVSGDSPLTVSFTTSVTDADGTIVSAIMYFGDGTSRDLTAPSDVFSHIYAQPGVYTAVVFAQDNEGLVTSEDILISVDAPMAPQITLTANPLAGDAPLLVTFDVIATDDVQIVETLINFGDGTPAQPIQAISTTGHTYTNQGFFTASVSARDNDGFATMETVIISVGILPPPSGNHDPNVNYIVNAGAVDASNGVLLDDVTFQTLNDFEMGNPFASFTLNSDTEHDMSAVAAGYNASLQTFYFDHNLTSCDGSNPSCTLSSEDVVGTTVITQCDLSVSNTPNGTAFPLPVYLCTPTVGEEFFYDYLLQEITVFFELDANQIFGTPGIITLTVTPTTGEAPLDITLFFNATDVDGLSSASYFISGPNGFFESTVFDFLVGDEFLFTTGLILPEPGIYTVSILATDNLGETTSTSQDITATDFRGEIPVDDDAPGIFVRSLRLSKDTVTAGDSVTLNVAFENDGDFKLKNAKVIASIPELGIRRSTGADTLFKNEERREIIILDLPEDIEGTFYVRVQIKADGIDRVVHREITIEKEVPRQNVGLFL